jgi:hypothetical protein
MQLKRTAIATLVPLKSSPGNLPGYSVSWIPERGGPYPSFTGHLSIEHADDYGLDFKVTRSLLKMTCCYIEGHNCATNGASLFTGSAAI